MHITATCFNVAGLIANIIGTIILAFSLNGYIKSIRLAIDAHELYILSVNHPNRRLPIYQVTGTDTHMNRDRRRSGIFSWVGLFFVLAGFALQLYSYFQ
jgi:hypothetical protein